MSGIVSGELRLGCVHLRGEGNRRDRVVARALAADNHAAVSPQLAALNHANSCQIPQVADVSLLHCVRVEQGLSGGLGGGGEPLPRRHQEVAGQVKRDARSVEVGGGLGLEP
jgi:hypothetical protein